jgi:AraC family transcriptional regulator
MKTTTRETYARRIARVSAYLIDHLDNDHDLHRLAEEACFSAYHFHRIYRMTTGETVKETLKRLRLHRAAVKLISSNIDITVLGLEAGYSSVQAFSRAFRINYGVAPSEYRDKQFRIANNGDAALHQQLKRKLTNPTTKEHDMYEVTIDNATPCRVAALQHAGDYMEIGNTFEQLTIWAAGQGLVTPDTRSFGIYYDDPAAVDKDKLRSDACIAIPADFTLSGADATKYRVLNTPAGRCATLIHVGPYSDLEKAYHWLFGVWLPQSGEEPADAPSFEEYLNDPRQVAPSALRTAVCLPLKS